MTIPDSAHLSANRVFSLKRTVERRAGMARDADSGVVRGVLAEALLGRGVKSCFA
jgi:hypothetical protein